MSRLRLLAVLLPALSAAVAPSVQAEEAKSVVSEAASRQTLDLTVYNGDLALVRDVRVVDLPAGTVPLEFRDVPARIDPTSLRVDGGKGFAILEQNYEFDLLSRERILQKYVGRELGWLQEDGSVIRGTLLGMNDGPVYRVDGSIVFEVPGRIVLPTLPVDLRDRPTLVWIVEADGAQRRRVEASYLTAGLSWHADYVLDLDAAGREAGMQAWVTLENRSGAGYEAATLRLVAGDINRASTPPRPEYMMAMADAAPTAKGFSEQSLYDYHLYTLGRSTDLKDQQIKQVSLFEREGIPVERHYRLPAGRGLQRGDDRESVDVSYRFRNAASARLGLPLPAGVVRVYGTADGGRQLLGEDRIRHTPKDETVELTVGRAFDIVGERVVTESVRLGDRGERRTTKVTLRNHKEEAVVVAVEESAWGEWNVTASTLPVRRISATELAFDVPVKADGQTELVYTIEINR